METEPGMLPWDQTLASPVPLCLAQLKVALVCEYLEATRGAEGVSVSSLSRAVFWASTPPFLDVWARMTGSIPGM